MGALVVVGIALAVLDSSGERASEIGTSIVVGSEIGAADCSEDPVLDIGMNAVAGISSVAEDVVGDSSTGIGATIVLLDSEKLSGVGVLPEVSDDAVVWDAGTRAMEVLTVDESMSVHDPVVELGGAGSKAVEVCADGIPSIVTNGEV